MTRITKLKVPISISFQRWEVVWTLLLLKFVIFSIQRISTSDMLKNKPWREHSFIIYLYVSKTRWVGYIIFHTSMYWNGCTIPFLSSKLVSFVNCGYSDMTGASKSKTWCYKKRNWNNIRLKVSAALAESSLASLSLKCRQSQWNKSSEWFTMTNLHR